MASKLITKKEMKRNSKAQLLKIAKNGGLQVSKKMSKVMIVDMIFKTKSLRASMKAPAKKQPSAAQLAARKKCPKTANPRTTAKFHLPPQLRPRPHSRSSSLSFTSVTKTKRSTRISSATGTCSSST